jgi:hypothetical protein
MGEVATAEDWIRMYRQGVSGAGIARIFNVDDILEVLTTLAAAKEEDTSVADEHAANLATQVQAVESTLPSLRLLTPAFRARVEELAAFVKENGRMPRQSGGGREETSLGRWLHAQRSNVDKGKLDPRQRAALGALGAWESPYKARREEARFPERLRALAAFQARKKRLPSYRNRDDDDERALGIWLHTLRQAAGEDRLPDSFRRALDQSIPGWNL